MSLPALSFFQLAYTSNPPMLRGASLRQLSAEEITQACELLLATAQQHDCPYWLLDGRRHQQEQPRTLHQWLQEDYFPRAWAALGRLPSVAFLSPSFARENVRLQNQPAGWQAPAVHIRSFADETQAQAWLNQQRTHDALAVKQSKA